MISIRVKDELRPRVLISMGILIALGIGVMSIYQPQWTLLGILGVLGLSASLKLLTLSRKAWWVSWLGIVAVSAFGPFLDIVTHQPVNWLIGLMVLLLFALLLAKPILHQVVTHAAKISLRIRLPVLGFVFLLYNLYFLLQALRPGVEIWNGLLAFRTPLIGLAAYFLTMYGFDAHMNRRTFMDHLRQFLYVFVTVGMIVADYGLFQFVAGFDRLQAWGLTEAGGLYFHYQINLNEGAPIFRIFSTMRRNEVLGAFLYLNIVAGAIAFRLELRPRWLTLTSLALSSAALILTLSLTSLVTLGIWIGLLVFTSGSKRLVGRAIALGVLSVLVTLGINQLLGGLIGIRFEEHVLHTQEGRGRVQMFLNWIAETSERPLLQIMFGSGLCTGVDEDTLARIGNVLSTLGIRVGALFECGWKREVHDNWYATHSLEIGWFGLLLIWLVFGLVPVYILPRLRRRWKEPERGAWTMLALGVLAVWPSGFVTALILYMPITLYFWSMVALLDAGAATVLTEEV